MAEEELEEIKNLPPEERIKKLKEIEEKKKKEISEAEKLIKASIEEARDVEAKEKIEELLERGETKMLQSEAEKRLFESMTGEKFEKPEIIESEEEREKPRVEEHLEDALRKEEIDPEIIKQQQSPYRTSFMENNPMYAAINNTVNNQMYDFRQGMQQEDLEGYYQSASNLKNDKPDKLTSNYQKSLSDEMLDNTIWARKVLKSMGYETSGGGMY